MFESRIAVSKFNIGRRPKAITYRIVECPDDPEIGKVEILDIDGNFTADDNPSDEKVESKFDRCCQWLGEFLSGGEGQQEEGQRAAEAEGFSYGTVKRAKTAIGVKSKQRGFRGVGIGLSPQWRKPIVSMLRHCVQRLQKQAHAKSPAPTVAQAGSVSHCENLPIFRRRRIPKNRPPIRSNPSHFFAPIADTTFPKPTLTDSAMMDTASRIYPVMVLAKMPVDVHSVSAVSLRSSNGAYQWGWSIPLK